MTGKKELGVWLSVVARLLGCWLSWLRWRRHSRMLSKAVIISRNGNKTAAAYLRNWTPWLCANASFYSTGSFTAYLFASCNSSIRWGSGVGERGGSIRWGSGAVDGFGGGRAGVVNAMQYISKMEGFTSRGSTLGATLRWRKRRLVLASLSAKAALSAGLPLGESGA